MKKNKKTKSNIAVNIEFSFFIVAISIIKLLPLKLCYMLAKVLSISAYHLDFLHKKRIVRNLIHAGLTSDPGEAAKIAKKNFMHFGMLLVEIFKFREIITAENIRQHIKYSGRPKNTKFTFGGNGAESNQAIIVTGHFGNWEIAGMGYALLSGKEMLTIMRPFDNYKIGEYLESMRVGHKHRVRHKKGALKALVDAVRKKQSICFVSDQHASSGEGVETVFFGHPARSHSAPSALHLKTHIPIVVGGLVRNDENFNFEFIVQDVIEYTPTTDKEQDLRNVTQLYTSALEELIRHRPEQWMWAHRRWLDLERRQATNKVPVK